MKKTCDCQYATPAAIFAAGLVIAAAVLSGAAPAAVAAQPAPAVKAAAAGCGV